MALSERLVSRATVDYPAQWLRGQEMQFEGLLGYRLVRSPSRALLDEVFQLRARAWRARAPKFPADVVSWSDAFDADSKHFVACQVDGSPVAAARLTVTDAVHKGPDFETYRALDCYAFEKPLSFLSRLVVCPHHAGRGLAQALDETRLSVARELGCKTVLASTRTGERRIHQLEGYGFRRLCVVTSQTGPLTSVADVTTVLTLTI